MNENKLREIVFIPDLFYEWKFKNKIISNKEFTYFYDYVFAKDFLNRGEIFKDFISKFEVYFKYNQDVKLFHLKREDETRFLEYLKSKIGDIK